MFVLMLFDPLSFYLFIYFLLYSWFQLEMSRQMSEDVLKEEVGL